LQLSRSLEPAGAPATVKLLTLVKVWNGAHRAMTLLLRVGGFTAALGPCTLSVTVASADVAPLATPW
jgi:hypothetical protein